MWDMPSAWLAQLAPRGRLVVPVPCHNLSHRL
jgi:protein-L-isoaspartate O-methyltransferase